MLLLLLYDYEITKRNYKKKCAMQREFLSLQNDSSPASLFFFFLFSTMLFVVIVRMHVINSTSPVEERAKKSKRNVNEIANNLLINKYDGKKKEECVKYYKITVEL